MRFARARQRFDRRTAIGLGLALAAGALAFVVTRPAPTVAVLVAEGPLAAGIPLEQLPVGVRRVPDATGMVAEGDPAALAGWTLSGPLAVGEPLLPSLLRPPERLRYPDVLALALERGAAVLGDLTAGDRVDVYATPRWGETAEPARLVAAGVYVVSAAVGSPSLGGDDLVELLLAVDEDLAAILVTARREGEIDLVRVSR